MADQTPDKRRHFLLRGTAETLDFTGHRLGGSRPAAIPELSRQQHGARLQAQLQALKAAAEAAAVAQSGIGLKSGFGLQVQFESQAGVQLAFESLANERGKVNKVELLSIKELEEAGSVITSANVFVPHGKLAQFEEYVRDYMAVRTDKNGKPRDHKTLLNTINVIRGAGIRDLWSDDYDLLPKDETESFWWEVWLTVRGQREAVIEDFRKLASETGCCVGDHHVDFPERTVVLMYGSQRQFSQSVVILNCVAELRRAKETAEFFDGMKPSDQKEWLDAALKNAQFPQEGCDIPHVCLLDSGVNRGHPLLAPVLADTDMHTVEPAWGTDDTANHGSGLAGLAVFGDLTEALASIYPLAPTHRLESVKLVPSQGTNKGNADHHACLFAEAISRPEIAAPQRRRVFTSAVSASDYRDQGRPSAWSAKVDQLVADYDGGGLFPRLIILAAGNSREQTAWMHYPDSLSTNLIHDPGQSWNALTVGAYTEKTEADGLTPVAVSGDLSPFTTTSMTWDAVWPFKPDVVLEGGNVGKDDRGAVGMPSLNLLTTNYRPQDRLFTTTNATSAASALCARLAAKIMAAYPSLRPETLRALIVHSAEWTPAMRNRFLRKGKGATKQDYVNIIRHCGWGVPDLDRALWSAGHSLTLIIEDELYPYVKRKGGGLALNKMNLHSLPWPREELEALQSARVQMRVTLSYFVEPNPSSRGVASKYHYPSHRLRFEVQRPLDTSTQGFVARINAAVKTEDDGEAFHPKDSEWYLGVQNRHRGSLHQDVWEGTAAQLAARGYIAVYPATGWWRTRRALERYDRPARYSLVVSIRTEETDVDLYNAIAREISVSTTNEILS